MKILITIGHPGHVHFYKNFVWTAQKKGHEVTILAEKKEVSTALLRNYNLEYRLVSEQKHKGILRIFDQLSHELGVYKFAKGFKPDIITGIGGTAAAHVAKVLGCTSIIFTDSEPAKLANAITFPFANVICTPSCYRDRLDEKQIRYNGYHELAYLHPNRFTPNPAVLDELGLAEGDPFIIVRFVSWDASHDAGQHGIHDKVGLVKALEQYGRVLITSEGALPEELQPYQIRVSPEKLHDLLYYATLYVGDGGTTASEAAVLGTPAIFISTLYCGYQLDEEKYGLLYLFSDPVSGVKNGLRKAVALLNDPNLKENAYLNRLKLLEDKIDVTEFMVWFVENYPESCHQIKADPEKQYPLATS